MVLQEIAAEHAMCGPDIQLVGNGKHWCHHRQDANFQR